MYGGCHHEQMPTLTLAAVLLAPLAVLLAADVPKLTGKPNILFILADDLGCAMSAVSGAHFIGRRTSIGSRRGMMFTQAYAAAPICSPTRASLLTGLWPARIGITSPVCHQPEEYLEELLHRKRGRA